MGTEHTFNFFILPVPQVPNKSTIKCSNQCRSIRILKKIIYKTKRLQLYTKKNPKDIRDLKSSFKKLLNLFNYLKIFFLTLIEFIDYKSGYFILFMSILLVFEIFEKLIKLLTA